jgi:hypothetical protein
MPGSSAHTASNSKKTSSHLYEEEEFPLFGKWFDETHHPELIEGEGLGKIFTAAYFQLWIP